MRDRDELRAEGSITDEGGRGPEAADLQGLGLKRKNPWPVRGPVAMRPKRSIDQAPVQSQACRACKEDC